MLKYIAVFLVVFIFNTISYRVFSSESHDVVFTKTVTNITQQSEASALIHANPGDIIEYNIYIANSTYNAISNINIYASVPLFTVLATTINCNASNLLLALSCQILTPGGANDSGYQGEIIWQLVGKLEAGATARVSYQVKIK